MKKMRKNLFLFMLMSLVTLTAYAQKEKKLKIGKFVYEGNTVDGKTPSGKGVLFVKYQFNNVQLITNATYDGWNGNGVLECPFWTFNGNFEVTKNSLILKPGGKLKIACFTEEFPTNRDDDGLFKWRNYRESMVVSKPEIPFGFFPLIYSYKGKEGMRVEKYMDIVDAELVKPVELDASDGISPIIDGSCLKFENDRLIYQHLFGKSIPYNIEKFFFDELGDVSVKATIEWVSFTGYQDDPSLKFWRPEDALVKSGYYCLKYNFDNLTISKEESWNKITNNKSGRNFYTDRVNFISYLDDTESIIYKNDGQDGTGYKFNWRVSKIYNDGSGVSDVYIEHGGIVIKNGWAWGIAGKDLPGLNRSDLSKEGIKHGGDGSKSSFNSWLCYSDKKWITNRENYAGYDFHLVDGPRDNDLEVIKVLLSAQTLPRVEESQYENLSLAMYEGTKQLGTINKNGFKSVAQSDKEVAQKRAKQKAEDDAAYKQLCEMFGKKYVDAVFSGRIIIGMPEKLFVTGINKNMFTNISGATLSGQNTTKKYYDLKALKMRETRSSLRTYTGTVGQVVVTNGRISSIQWY